MFRYDLEMLAHLDRFPTRILDEELLRYKSELARATSNQHRQVEKRDSQRFQRMQNWVRGQLQRSKKTAA